MRNVLFLGLCLTIGCGGSGDDGSMIGKTVIVSSAEPSKMNGQVLIVDPGGVTSDVVPIFVNPFRAVVIDVVPVTDKGTDLEMPERWQVRVEDGQAAGRVVNVTKRSVKLTPLK